jgi:hypothetical protein
MRMLLMLLLWQGIPQWLLQCCCCSCHSRIDNRTVQLLVCDLHSG